MKKLTWRCISPAKENVTSSGKDLLSMTKQVNDPLLYITEKNQRKFSIEIWRYYLERYLWWHFKNLFFYFQNSIPKLYFWLALPQMALRLWNAHNETAGQVPRGHGPAMSKELPLRHRPCYSSWAALSETFLRDGLLVCENNTEFFYESKMWILKSIEIMPAYI